MFFEANSSIVYEIFRKPFRFFQAIKSAFQSMSEDTARDRYYQLFTGIHDEDISFYVGVFTEEHFYSLSNMAGPTRKLVVFVPTENSYDHLVNTVRMRQWKNISIVPLTFSLRPKENGPNETIPLKLLSDVKGKKFSQKVELNAEITLDEYCISLGICPKHVEIKLPWHELVVLQGATDMLKKCRPKLTIECDEWFLGRKNVQKVFQFLIGLDYKGFFILDGVLIPLQQFDFDIHQNRQSTIYCTRFIFE